MIIYGGVSIRDRDHQDHQDHQMNLSIKDAHSTRLTPECAQYTFLLQVYYFNSTFPLEPTIISIKVLWMPLLVVI